MIVSDARAFQSTLKMQISAMRHRISIYGFSMRHMYEGLLRTKYRICIYPCYVAYMNAMRNKSISKHVRYKLKVSDKTKRCLTQLKDAW